MVFHHIYHSNHMDSNNPVITHCIEGIWAEIENRFDDARLCYQKAWNSRTNDYEACIAAHYVARSQTTPEESLGWNLLALELAYAVTDEKIRNFFPSLYMSLGYSYESLGGKVQAQRYYRLAAGMGEVLDLESEGELVQWVKTFDWIQPLLGKAA